MRAIEVPITVIGTTSVVAFIADVVKDDPFVTVLPLIVRIYELIFAHPVLVHQRNFVVLIFAIFPTTPLD